MMIKILVNLINSHLVIIIVKVNIKIVLNIILIHQNVKKNVPEKIIRRNLKKIKSLVKVFIMFKEKMKWCKNLFNMVLSKLLLLYMKILWLINREFINKKMEDLLVDMQLNYLVMVKKMELNIGLWLILGIKIGVKKVTLK